MTVAVQIARMIIVIALLGVAAAIATPKGRLPLALRGLAKILKTNQSSIADIQPPTLFKRVLALVIVVLAVVLAMI